MKNRQGIFGLALRSIGTCAPLIATPAANAQQPPALVVYNVNTVADLVDDNVADGICHTSANTCSLRAAVMQANHLGTPGIVRIQVPAGTYVLSRLPNASNGEDSGDLNLTAPLSAAQSIAIIGAGATSTFIDGNLSDGVIPSIRPRVDIAALRCERVRTEGMAAESTPMPLSIADIVQDNIEYSAVASTNGGSVALAADGAKNHSAIAAAVFFSTGHC